MIIPRGRGNPLAALAALVPAIFLTLSRGRLDFPGYVALASVAGVVAAFMWLGIYQRRTPLLKIADDCLTFYGWSPNEKRMFSLSEITKVKFFSKLNFWRSGRLLLIQSNSETYNVWLPNSKPAEVMQIQKLLKTRFEEKYVEIAS